MPANDSRTLLNQNDSTQLDLELITKDYHEGYLSPFVGNSKVEQIKWNINQYPNRYKTTNELFAYRENAIQYANILHKRKYKKFTLRFIKSEDFSYENTYIIAFETERNRWNYTNKGYPTKYSGKIFIDKKSYAIVKVIENWETTLNQAEIIKYHRYFGQNTENIKSLKIKEENIGEFSINSDNNKYIATRFFGRKYSEITNNQGKVKRNIFEKSSYLYDFEFDNIEEIEYEYYEKDLKNTLLNRVEYDESFWNSFYQRKVENEFKL